MLFSEIYGSYFQVVADIIDKAIAGELTEKALYKSIEEKGFSESGMYIPKALQSQEWPIITSNYETPIVHAPSMPLTMLQKRWLKSLLNDPKIKLFGVSAAGLEDVEPLFDQNTIVYFDQYADGDNYSNEDYIRNFRTILQAFREKRKVQIQFTSIKSGKDHTWTCLPQRLEYSLKDDKFRIITQGLYGIDTINLATITECTLLEHYDEAELKELQIPKRQIVFELVDERNALERVMLHFSHLQKETVKLSDQRYQVKLMYNKQDETEILIRILSFGPMVKVVEPESFIELIRERLNMQRTLECEKSSQLFFQD